jgi:hypothetical protein
MKTIYRYVVLLSMTLFIASTTYPGRSLAQQSEALEQRVARWDVAAIKEAGRQGRTDLIPELEKAANAAAAPDEPTRIWAKAALAKLGEKKYLNETISELTTTNSDLFAENWKFHGAAVTKEIQMLWAKYDTQETAFKKLAYINDPSTIKTVAHFLYDTEKKLPQGDNALTSPAGFAILALRKMVKDPPDAGKQFSSSEELYAVWQQWWEQNKDKYP